jgi:hypothetical protein
MTVSTVTAVKVLADRCVVGGQHHLVGPLQDADLLHEGARPAFGVRRSGGAEDDHLRRDAQLGW